MQSLDVDTLDQLRVALPVISVVLATLWAAWWSRGALAPASPLPLRQVLRTGAPGMLVGLLFLVGLLASPYVDPDSIGSLRRTDADAYAFLLSDAGFPSLVHNLLRLATGTDRSIPGTTLLNLLIFVAYAAACAAACARTIDATLAPYAAFVATLAPPFSRFHEARASVLAAAFGAIALAWSQRGARHMAASPIVVAAIGLATLDNPLCILWLAFLAWIADPQGRARWSWIGAGAMLVMGQLLPIAMVFSERANSQGGREDGDLLGFVIGCVLLVAPVEALRRSPSAEQARWRHVSAAVLFLALLGVMSGTMAGWKIAVWFWPMIVLAGALGTLSRVTPARARRVWTLAAALTLGRAVFEGPLKVGIEQQLATSLVGWVQAHAAPGEAIVVVPSHHFIQLVTGGGVLAPGDVTWPTTPVLPYFPGMGEPGGRPVCIAPAGSVSWVLLYELTGTDVEPEWRRGCSSCERAESFWRAEVWRCVSDGQSP